MGFWAIFDYPVAELPNVNVIPLSDTRDQTLSKTVEPDLLALLDLWIGYPFKALWPLGGSLGCEGQQIH